MRNEMLAGESTFDLCPVVMLNTFSANSLLRLIISLCLPEMSIYIAFMSFSVLSYILSFSSADLKMPHDVVMHSVAHATVRFISSCFISSFAVWFLFS